MHDRAPSLVHGVWVPAFAGTTARTDLRWPWFRTLFHMIRVTGDRIDHRDLPDREVGHDLDRILVHDQHLLDPHAVAEALAVLRLEREGHAFLDLDRMVERPDARD